jgi:hypothetical protein
VDQGAALPSLALSAEASAPWFAPGFDQALFVAYASKDVGAIHVDANGGLVVGWGGGLSGAAAQPYGALAVSASPVPPFGLALEAYAFASAGAFAPRDGGLRGAISATPRSWFVVDVGADLGWFPSTRAYGVFAGMTIIPVVWWHGD